MSSIEPKVKAYAFKMEDYCIYSTGSTPFQDVELDFNGHEVIITSENPKTRKEFEKIFNDFLKKKEEDKQRMIKLRKRARELAEEDEYDD